MSSQLVRVVIIAIVAIAVTAWAASLVGRSQSSQAGRLLHDLYQMKPDSTTYEAARDLTIRYGGHSVGECTKEACQFDITISNEAYSKLGLARPKQFSATLLVKDGRVKRISFSIVCSPSHIDQNPFGIGVSVTDESCFPCYEGQRSFLAKANGVDSDRPMQIIIEVTRASTLEQRKAAYALDLVCLSELGECPRLDKVAPAAWQEIRQQTMH